MKVTYLGSTNVEGSKDTVKFTVADLNRARGREWREPLPALACAPPVVEEVNSNCRSAREEPRLT